MPINYQDESDEEQNQYISKLKKSNFPRFVKNSMDNIAEDQIIINLSKTQYDIIQTAAEELGWTVQYSKKSQKWDVMWVDRYIQPQQLFRLNDHQKISHFPGIDIFAKKNLLGKNLMKMFKYFPQEYNYFPWTWSLPSQYGQLKRYEQNLSTQNKKQIYIFKPSASCQGKGIKITQNTQQLEGKNGIAQIYINNPLLIQNLKFDLRLYVLIYGHDPIRIYLYDQGLARFATENYVKAQKTNMKDTYIHLTNYAINKNNKKFVFNKDQSNMDKGHKRSVSFVYRYLDKKGVDTQQLKRKIQHMIVKTLLIGQPMLSHVYHLAQPDNACNDLVFHILGFDILITQKYEPVLLEINHTPSFSTDTPLDKKIKKNLIKDTLKILNINLESKKDKISKKIQFQQKRSQRKTTKLTGSQKNLLKQKLNNQKNQHESNNPCGYKRIYPNEKVNYENIETQATRIFQEQNRLKQNSKISPSKYNLTDFQSSPNKLNRQRALSGANTLSNIPKMQKNLSYQQKNSVLKKIPNSQTVSIRSNLKSRLPNISATKGSTEISMSAHFPKTIVKKVQFNGQDIFKDIQKKRVISTQRIQKKKKAYLKQQNSELQKQNTLTPNSKIDDLFNQAKTLNLGNERKFSLNEKQQSFFQFLNQSSLQLLKIKKDETQKLRDILFNKKSVNTRSKNF